MPSPQDELDDVLLAEIRELCAIGDRYANEGDYAQALTEYNLAWRMIPEPKNNWEASTWILGAIADASFLSGNDGPVIAALEYAMTCPGGLGNPFLHLRLGQSLYRAGKTDWAANELMRAYMGAGEEIFSLEDPKYLEFLKTRAKL